MNREELATDLKRIDPETDYYAITLLGDPDGKIRWSAYSHWAGWVGGTPGREIREASIVNPSNMAETWVGMGQGYLVVNSEQGFLIYMRYGGNALVAREIGEKYFQGIIRSHETAYDSTFGFKSARDLEPYVFKRAPRPKQRMKIIQRDQFKCRICGRSPDNYTDIELHVHHIRPWGKGGLTEDENLLTLCNTCHDGLQPHEVLSLFRMIDPNELNSTLSKRKKEYLEGTGYYRKWAERMFSDFEKNGQAEND